MPLYCADSANSLDIVHLLIHAGANTHLIDEDGMTPLHLAVSESSTSTLSQDIIPESLDEQKYLQLVNFCS